MITRFSVSISVCMAGYAALTFAQTSPTTKPRLEPISSEKCGIITIEQSHVLREQITKLQAKYEDQDRFIIPLEARMQQQSKDMAVLRHKIDRQDSFISLAHSNERQISQLLKDSERGRINLTDVLMVIISALLFVLSVFAWQVNRRIAWLTGAMESHSEMMLRIEAANKEIPVKWWDPTRDGRCKSNWPTKPEHDTDATVKKLYIGLPPHLRRNSDSCWCGLKHFFISVFNCLRSIVLFWRK